MRAFRAEGPDRIPLRHQRAVYRAADARDLKVWFIGPADDLAFNGQSIAKAVTDLSTVTHHATACDRNGKSPGFR